MTTRIPRFLVLLAAAALALRASAHEVDCSKLAAIALPDPGGAGPLLDPSGLPSLAAPPAVALTVDHYPALVAFDLEIRNLASEPSVISTVSDALLPDPARLRSFGDVLGGTIPVGGRLRRVSTVAVRSFEDCLLAFPVDPASDAPVCGRSREDTLLVTTDSDIAACRAHVMCAPQVVGPPPPPPPPPSICTAPTWTGALQAPVLGVDFAWGDAVGCDGVTWLAGSVVDPLVVTTRFGAVLRVDPAGQFSLIRLDDTADAVRVDGHGFLDVAGRRPIGNVLGAGAAVRQLDPVGVLRWEYDAPDFAPPAGPASGAVDADLDTSSNVYFAYRTTAPARGTEIALVKLTPDGTVVWTTQLGTEADDELGHVAVAPDGGIFVAGTTTGTFPGQTGAGGLDAFLAHLDPSDGHLVWVRQLGTAGADLGAAVAVDPRDGARVALVGTTAGPLDGGAAAAATDAYVALFDRAGTPLWTRELRATPATPPIPPAVTGSAVAIDQAGAVWIGGSAFAGSIPGGTFSLALGADGIVARYDASGTYLWGRHFTEGSDTQITDLAIDPSGSGVASANGREGLSRRAIDAIRISPDGT